ncbi:twin-arginine translocase TatA/TatE family subunit [Bacillus sp. FJAT-27251]|uniref:twin-arginine translocase TatA/TatE family subunit n=1 Tax=Bacillus sp. FJAT-27251 TaxID=1684142 RepID=UPI0006A76121|nr:twin-arginine translocase TatA/TatE family subunit [Bacillus sp. FJAT-27251]
MSQIGVPGLIFLVILLIFLFGSKNLPDIGRSLGKGLNEFKAAINNSKTHTIEKNNHNSADKEANRE